MIQLGPHGVSADDARIDALRAEFAQHQGAMLPGFLAPPLRQFLLRHVAAARFVPKSETYDGHEFGRTLFVPQTEIAWNLLQLFVNRPALFRLVERITGCPAIGNFHGRIHRSEPGGEHQIAWHADSADSAGNTRLVGLNVSLSTQDFTGGEFQLRRKHSAQTDLAVPRLPAGDAFLFSISPDMEHRLTAVESGADRVVAVGWFRSQPDWPTFSRTLMPRPIPAQEWLHAS